MDIPLHNIADNVRILTHKKNFHPNSCGIVYQYRNGAWQPHLGNGWRVLYPISKKKATGRYMYFFAKNDATFQHALDKLASKLASMYPITKEGLEVWFFNVENSLSVGVKSPEMRTMMLNIQQFKTYTT